MPGNAQGIRAGKAFVEASLDDSKLTRGLKAMEAKFAGFGTAIVGVGSKLGAIGAAVVAPLFAAAKSFADAGSELADASARTGASVSALSELGHAAQQTGTDLATVETGFRKMQKALVAGTEENLKAQATFLKLGLSVEKLAKLSPEDQFGAVTAAIARIPNPTLKAAAAMEIFGKSGTALIPMIDDLDALRKEARELGLVWSKEDAEAADQFGDALDNVSAMVKRGVQLIGAALVPDLLAAAGAFMRLAKTTLDWIDANHPLVAMVGRLAIGAVAAGAAITTLGLSFKVAGLALGGIAAAIGAMFSPLALVTAGLVAGGIALARYTDFGGQALGWLGERFSALTADATAAFQGIADALAAGDIALAGQVLWAALKVEWLKGVAALNAIWADWGVAVRQGFADVSTNLASAWVNLWSGLEAVAVKSWGFLRGGWSALSNSISDIWLDLGVQLGTYTRQQAEDAKAILDRELADKLAGREKERQAQLAGIEAERQAQQQAIQDQAAAEREARQQAAQAGVDAANEELRKAQEALARFAKQAADQRAGIAAAPKRPDFTPEGLDAGLTSTARKVESKGSFNAAALRGLALGDTVAGDQLKEAKKTNEKLDKMRRDIQRGGAAFA